MPGPMRATLVLTVLALVATVPVARGSLIVIPFTGPITATSTEPGPLPGFPVGDVVTGSLSYDPAAVTAVLPQTDPRDVFYRLPVLLSFSLGGGYSFSAPVPASAEVRNDLTAISGDQWIFQDLSAMGGPNFQFALTDPTGTALASAALPTAPIGAAFGAQLFAFAERAGGQAGGQGRSFAASVRTPAVPEPPTGVLALAGLAVAGGWAAVRRWWWRGRVSP